MILKFILTLENEFRKKKWKKNGNQKLPTIKMAIIHISPYTCAKIESTINL
jgi:hypothetical protein